MFAFFGSIAKATSLSPMAMEQSKTAHKAAFISHHRQRQTNSRLSLAPIDTSAQPKVKNITFSEQNAFICFSLVLQ